MNRTTNKVLASSLVTIAEHHKKFKESSGDSIDVEYEVLMESAARLGRVEDDPRNMFHVPTGVYSR